MTGDLLKVEDHRSVISVSSDDMHNVGRFAAGLADADNGLAPRARNKSDDLF
jgi:hypothetical protein